ncbi:hypothetical protein [Leptolyngbya sp. PCC 6406]|uniref:hypothetical protein n=1 Tax=Leptolyngbya sp. PCC 6406 TaxID=1173264 RepID=UPI0002ACEE78|nr:hypothetical protein [Leptolyngbya sp. PCC 6406]
MPPLPFLPALSLTETAAIDFPLVLGLMLWLHCLIGLVAARTAYKKGGNLGLWLPWGLLGGTIALITALVGPRRQSD